MSTINHVYSFPTPTCMIVYTIFVDVMHTFIRHSRSYLLTPTRSLWPAPSYVQEQDLVWGFSYCPLLSWLHIPGNQDCVSVLSPSLKLQSCSWLSHNKYWHELSFLYLSFFQVFISDGKILQFRTDSMESQAHWMAALKVGLGKGGSIIWGSFV